MNIESMYFCMYCLQCFSSENVLSKHRTNYITINGKQAIKMPEKDNNILKFNNFYKQLPIPFVIYADFKLTDKIPVIFHNLRGYDSHFIMQEIGEIVKKHTYKNKKKVKRNRWILI